MPFGKTGSKKGIRKEKKRKEKEIPGRNLFLKKVYSINLKKKKLLTTFTF